jgi:hypothetical protein
MYFKKLVGKKCYLSPIDPNDAAKYTGWLNDMEILANIPLYNGVINLENEKGFLGRLANEHNYAIVDAAKEELIVMRRVHTPPFRAL